MYVSTIATETPDKYPFEMSSLLLSLLDSFHLSLKTYVTFSLRISDVPSILNTRAHFRKISSLFMKCLLLFTKKILGFKLVISNLINHLSQFTDRQVEVHGNLNDCSLSSILVNKPGYKQSQMLSSIYIFVLQFFGSSLYCMSCSHLS